MYRTDEYTRNCNSEYFINTHIHFKESRRHELINFKASFGLFIFICYFVYKNMGRIYMLGGSFMNYFYKFKESDSYRGSC